jgi:acetyltransferase-like isoleucine patch superfamily enzyme
MRLDHLARRVYSERQRLLDPKALLRQPPGVVARSLELSALAEPGDWFPMITALWSSRIQKHPSARLELGGHLLLGGWDGGPQTEERTKISLGPGSLLRTEGNVVIGSGTHIVVGPGAQVTLGPDSIISSKCRVVCRDSITLKAGAGLSWDTLVMDTDHHALVVDGVKRPRHAPIEIGEWVWGGAGIKIMKGVTIGDRAVIATGSVVVSDVPAHALVGGVPARVLRQNVDWII